MSAAETWKKSTDRRHFPHGYFKRFLGCKGELEMQVHVKCGGQSLWDSVLLAPWAAFLSLLFLDDIKGILEVDLYGSRNPQLCRLVYRDGRVLDFKHNSVFWRLSSTWGINTRKKYTFINLVFLTHAKKAKEKVKSLFKGTVSSTSSETPSKNDNCKNIFFLLFIFICGFSAKMTFTRLAYIRRKTISRVPL